MTYVATAQVVDTIKATRNRKKVFIGTDGGFDAGAVGAFHHASCLYGMTGVCSDSQVQV